MKYAILLAMLMGTLSGDQLHVSTEPLPLHPKAPCVREKGVCRPLKDGDFRPGSHAVIENMVVTNLYVHTAVPETWVQQHKPELFMGAYCVLVFMVLYMFRRLERWKLLRKARGLGMVRP